MDGTPAPGWYPDPQPGATGVRYWDGSRWTDQVAATVPAAPPFTPWGWTPGQPTPGTTPRPPASGGPVPNPPWSPAPTRVPTTLSRSDRHRLFAAIAALIAIVVAFATFAVVTRDHRNAPAAPVTADAGSPPYRPPLDVNGDPALVPYAVERQTTPARASVPAALYAVPNGTDVVTPASARAVVQSLWDARRRAIAGNDAQALSGYETGSALAIDADRACGCKTTDHLGPASRIIVAVPHARAFPASFFAQLSATFNGSAWGAVLVFTRAARAEPWRLAFAGGGQPIGDPNATFPFVVDAQGFAPAIPPNGAPPVPAILADYWQHAKDDGTTALPSALDPGTLTDQWAKQIVVNRQGSRNRGNGYLTYYLFYADPHTANYRVALTGGDVLQCGSIVEQETYVADAGQRFFQPGSRKNWGPRVTPGSYRAVTEISEYTPCFDYNPDNIDFAPNGVTPPDAVTMIGVR